MVKHFIRLRRTRRKLSRLIIIIIIIIAYHHTHWEAAEKMLGEMGHFHVKKYAFFFTFRIQLFTVRSKPGGADYVKKKAYFLT